jgi:predicted nucleotidyltransferase component of viral defense system
MLPIPEIIAWREVAPWADDDDVEQDLIITRAIFDIFSDPFLAERLAFRGGTALHKLYLAPAARYSEDIDLVQRRPEAIGPTFDRIRKNLIWLGSKPRTVVKGIPEISYGFETETTGSKRRLKIEINTHEHFAEVVDRQFDEPRILVRSCVIPTHTVNELLATKLRALVQRDKGRDLFDFWRAHQVTPVDVDPAAIVERFAVYMAKSEFEMPSAPEMTNRLLRMRDAGVFEEMRPLLRAGVAYDVAEALEWFEMNFVSLLRNWVGEPVFSQSRKLA